MQGELGYYLSLSRTSPNVSALPPAAASLVRSAYAPRASALVVGDASGDRYASSPSVDLDRPFFIASQTKLISALAIYGVMATNSSKLHLDSRPSEFFPEWPTAGFAADIRLKHLLAFTSGFGPETSWDTCGYKGNSMGIADCVREISSYEVRHAPGTSFQYVRWHLIVAAAMALRASGRDLSKAGWVDAVRVHVYQRSGISDTPEFPDSDCVGLGPLQDCWLQQATMPHFGGGLRTTARQFGQILHALLGGQLLPPPLLANFTAEHTTAVTHSYKQRAVPHWAQGHWLRTGTDGNPSARVAESMWGSFAWYDLSAGFYGVFVHGCSFAGTLQCILSSAI